MSTGGRKLQGRLMLLLDDGRALAPLEACSCDVLPEDPAEATARPDVFRYAPSPQAAVKRARRTMRHDDGDAFDVACARNVLQFCHI